MARGSDPSAHRCDLDDGLGGKLPLGLSEELQGGLGDIDRSPEIGFHQAPSFWFWDCLHLAQQTVAGIVDKDVDFLEIRERFFDRIVN